MRGLIGVVGQSFARLAFLAGLLFHLPARAAVLCPDQSSGHRLMGMALFDGDPRKLMSLVPATPPAKVGYINIWPMKSSSGLFIVCRFDGATLQFALPGGLSECRVDSTPQRTTAGCR